MTAAQPLILCTLLTLGSFGIEKSLNCFCKILSAVYFRRETACLPLLSDLLQLYDSSYRSPWRVEGRIDGDCSHIAVSPVSQRRLRLCPYKVYFKTQYCTGNAQIQLQKIKHDQLNRIEPAQSAKMTFKVF